ncbi:hypothetical protein GCM10010946_33130 [Undibacterium squillarum]|uniref:Secreted protein n=1 Tax=Undibacterium squillarum TaxID=1131567 RepID=A0ABQ2Y3I9_9BURK|nr:hypothetical protein GCM10010946_33130 [Undibacterium squillarum]
MQNNWRCWCRWMLQTWTLHPDRRFFVILYGAACPAARSLQCNGHLNTVPVIRMYGVPRQPRTRQIKKIR